MRYHKPIDSDKNKPRKSKLEGEQKENEEGRRGPRQAENTIFFFFLHAEFILA